MKSTNGVLRASLVLAALTGFIDRALGVPISGTAFIANSASAGFDFSGLNISASSKTIDWTSVALLCTVNENCDATSTVPTSFSFSGFFPLNGSFGTFNGVTADVLAGALTFSGSVFIPADGGDHILPVTVPVTVQGEIKGYNIVPESLTPPLSLSPLLWDLGISGTGTLSASFLIGGDLAHSLGAEYTFEGIATPVPEPASILLLAAAIAALGLYRRVLDGCVLRLPVQQNRATRKHA